MYKATHNYSNSDPNVISFQPGETFNLIEQIDDHWWSMCGNDGRAGLVPASYLEINMISKEEVLASINQSVEKLQLSDLQKDSSRRNIQKLIENKEAILTKHTFWKTTELPQQPKRTAPKAPTVTPSVMKKGRSTKRNSAPLPPAAGLVSNSSSASSGKHSYHTDVDTGASSKIYNILVKKGDISPLEHDKTSIDSSDAPYILTVVKTSSSNNKDNSVYCRTEAVQSSSTSEQFSFDTDSIENSNQESSNTEVSKKITELKGKHVTISRSDDNEFKTLKSPVSKEKSNFYNHEMKNRRLSEDVGSENVFLLPSSERSSAIGDHVSRDSFVSDVSSTLSTKTNVYIPDELGGKLIDAVRNRCKISYNKSLAAVRCVLHHLVNDLPSVSTEISEIQRQIQDDNLKVHHGALANEDANRLYTILEKLVEHKEDSQQRNWAIQNDLEEIKDLLEDLISTMDEIDPSICRRVLEEDEFRYINDLVLYYQMESRSKIRISLLHVFGCFCQLGQQFVSTLLCSVLPTELAQDMMQDQKDVLKFLSSSLMLTMIFSTGESVPYNHYVQFNEKFVDFVLNTIEDPHCNDKDDQVPDALVAMLLAFNKHFKAPRHNVIMHCLARRSVFKTLSEKILLLFNREEDPVDMFKYSECCPDSVLKFLMDVFGSKETSGMFFTNDLYVLLDIVLRQIVDRAQKDKVRTEYLSLFHSLLNTTEYVHHQYRVAEFKRCFLNIEKNSESLESEVDLYIVKEILKRYASVFG